MAEENSDIVIKYGSLECCKCERYTGECGGGVRLQCEHAVCSDCLSGIITSTIGTNLEVGIFDRQTFCGLENRTKSAFQKTYFGTSNCPGIISCPKCDVQYSILSPIYREYGIPKRIEAVIAFKNDQGLDYFLHCCSRIDLTNLLPRSLQTQMLGEFQYSNELEMTFDNELVKKIKHVPGITYHMIVDSDNKIDLVDSLECKACDTSQYKHLSIYQFYGLLSEEA